MLKAIKLIMRNKIFYVFAILIVIMFPSTLYMQSDKDRTLIVTTIGIDKDDKSGEYEVTSLAIIPKGSDDVNANLEVFSSKGKTVSEALDNMSLTTGKKIGLAHCDSLVFSLDVIKENIAKTLDYFIRTSNLTTNATLIATDGKSSDLLNATKSSNNLLDLSLKNIINFQEEMSMLNNITIDRFYRTYYGKNPTFYLPILSVEKPDKNSSSTSSGGSGSQGNEPADSSSSGGGSSNGEKIKNDRRIALIENGRLVRELTKDEEFIYNLVSKDSNHARIEIDNINDQYVTNSKESYQQIDKIVVSKFYFDDDKPILKYSIWLSLMIDEISSSDNHSYSSMDSLQNYLSETSTKEIKSQIQDKLVNTVSLMKEYNNDIFEIYEHFNAFETKKWRNYLSTLENPDEYLDGVEVIIDIDLDYVI